MRFTMICIGSTGDVRPYVLLGRELKQRGHDVAICAFADFAPLVQKNGLRFYPLSGDAHEFIKNIMKPGTEGVAYMRQVLKVFRVILDPFLSDLQAACADADAVIATFFGNVIQSLAEKRNIPFIRTNYFMMDPNRLVPISSAPGLTVGPAWNLLSYRLAYLLVSMVEKHYLSGWRRAQGMPRRRLEGKPRALNGGHPVPTLYAMSDRLVPRPAEWNEHIYMTGFWTEAEQPAFTPSPELAAFLARDSQPVYIGFGSMTSGDMDHTLDLVVQAVRQSGVRAVLANGWGGGQTVRDENVFTIQGFVPHSWLFERVCAVVHHGGAGTTAAGLRAGKPTLVIPFGGDQPFWALRVRRMGLGPEPIPREKLTVSNLAAALRELTTGPGYRAAAEPLGAYMRAENGVQNAADIIEAETTLFRKGETDIPARAQVRPPETGVS